MSKKSLVILIITFVLGIVLGGTVIYYTITSQNNPTSNNNPEENETSLNLPTEGNDTIINTNSATTIRVVNEYDKSFFTADKNLLIMFASWCPNCQAEISEIQKILQRYKNNKNINIVLIAHEFEETITDLITLVEEDIDFGDVEIKLDLKRIIRKTIDPEASTIPISYVVDKQGKVLDIYDNSLTLEQAIQMLEK